MGRMALPAVAPDGAFGVALIIAASCGVGGQPAPTGAQHNSRGSGPRDKSPKLRSPADPKDPKDTKEAPKDVKVEPAGEPEAVSDPAPATPVGAGAATPVGAGAEAAKQPAAAAKPPSSGNKADIYPKLHARLRRFDIADLDEGELRAAQ